MSAVEFVVYGDPQTAGSKRAFTRRGGRGVIVTDDNKNLKEWQRLVADAARSERPDRLLDGPLRLHIRFYMARPKGHLGTGRNAGTVRPGAPQLPSTRPDTSKLVRAVEDALKGIVWRDDGQIAQLAALKLYAEPGDQPRCEVAIDPCPFRQSGGGSVSRLRRLQSAIGEELAVSHEEQLRMTIRMLEPDDRCTCGRERDPLARWCTCGQPTFSAYHDPDGRRAAAVLPGPGTLQIAETAGR